LAQTKEEKMKKAVVVLTLFTVLAALSLTACSSGPAPTAAPEEPTAAPEEPSAAPEEPTTAPPTPTQLLPEKEPPPTPTPLPPEEEDAPATSTPAPPLEISSTAFAADAEIPVQYTCEGENLSPPLEWAGVPEGTQSLALTVDDPDSDPPGYVHWVVYNIPASSAGFPEGVPAGATLPDGTLQGANDFAPYAGQTFPSGAPVNGIGYDGPCPPDRHRYVFTLYALDIVLDLPAEATMADLLGAIEGHVLGEAELIGVYTPQ
jgi:Raf kinase inhibitor-like YbhB/YbcL family protein